MATSTVVVPDPQVLGGYPPAIAQAVANVAAAVKADTEGLSAASLAATTPVGPGTGAAGSAVTASKSDHAHPPSTKVFRIQDAAASTATAETVILSFKRATTISAVKFCADAAVTQDDTDYVTITFKQGDGAAGSRSTVVSATSKTTGGVALAAFSSVSLGALSNAVVPAGGIATLTVTKSGAGQQLKGIFVVEFS